MYRQYDISRGFGLHGDVNLVQLLLLNFRGGARHELHALRSLREGDHRLDEQCLT